MRRFIATLTLLLPLAGATAAAQTFEAGATIAISCKGSDGSFCNDGYSGLFTSGPYAGVWFADWIELSGRIAWLKQPDEFGDLVFPPSIEFSMTDRRRTIVQAEIAWHFRRGSRVRPMIGLGLGGYHDRQTIACTPQGCEDRLPFTGLRAGDSSNWTRDASLMTGVSVAASDRVRIRGGWRYHNPFRDELALSELFIGAGLIF